MIIFVLGLSSQTYDYVEQYSVSIDQVRGGSMGIEYLVSLGHKKILRVSGPEHHPQSNQGFIGLTQAAREFCVEITTVSTPSLDVLSGEDLAPEFLAIWQLPEILGPTNFQPASCRSYSAWLRARPTMS